jgi:Dolichyl-phosphate-mannose-protein mannosyltransferase
MSFNRQTDKPPNASDDLTLDAESRFHRRFLWMATLVAAIALWVRPMFSSLWMDELGTWWIVKDSLHDAIKRSWDYQGQSPLFYVLGWFTRLGLGRSEIMLRLPSLIISVCTAYLLYRLARRLFDAEVARLSVFAFVTWEAVAFSASEFRPYALALFFLTASTLVLVIWLDNGDRRLGPVYALLAAAAVWSHYVFALALVAHVTYVLALLRNSRAVPSWRAILTAVGIFVVLVLPLLGQLLSLWGRRGSLTIPVPASFKGFLATIVPIVVVGGLGIGIVVAWLVGPIIVRHHEADGPTLALTVTWFLVPPTVLLALSFSPIHFVPGRYSMSAAPAGAMLVALGIRRIAPRSARRVIVAVFAIVAVLALGDSLKAGEDWRGAIAAINMSIDDRTVVMVHPGLVESAQLDWLTQPDRRSYLLSPLAYYPVHGRVVLLPFLLDQGAASYLNQVLAAQPSDTNCIILISRLPSVPYAAWFEGHLGQQGWTSSVRWFGGIEVTQFTRSVC